MKLVITPKEIKLAKLVNSLDRFVLEFVNVLDKAGIKYVLVSGYVSILFGRSRNSEDIDIIIEKLSRKKFAALWNLTYKKFYCINTGNAAEAYKEYLLEHISIRFALKHKVIPNAEVKFPQFEVERWVLQNRKKVVLNKEEFYISPIELQIPYKLFLGSEKDIEDAKHLYNVFSGKMDKKLLMSFLRKFNKVEEYIKYLK